LIFFTFESVLYIIDILFSYMYMYELQSQTWKLKAEVAGLEASLT